MSKIINLEKALAYNERNKHYFIGQLDILNRLFREDVAFKLDQMKVVLGSSCQTGAAVLKLSEDIFTFYSEMVMVSRSFLEKLINLSYLSVCDEEERKRYKLHAYYRTFHNLNREKTAGKGNTFSLKYTGQDKLKDFPEVREALELFSETNPKLNWSTKKLDERVAFLDGKVDINVVIFLMSTVTIYSDASEALHGSFFGSSLSTCFFDIHVDQNNIEEVKVHILESTALTYLLLGSVVHEFVQVIALNNQIPEIIKKDKINQEEVKKILGGYYEK